MITPSFSLKNIKLLTNAKTEPIVPSSVLRKNDRLSPDLSLDIVKQSTLQPILMTGITNRGILEDDEDPEPGDLYAVLLFDD